MAIAAWSIGGLVVAVVGFVAVVVIGFAMSIEHLDHNHRRHLAPIPVSAAACPSVGAIHAAATAFQNAYVNLPVAQSTAPNWPATRSRIARAADELTWTIAVRRDQFPAPVRRQLDVVLSKLGRGHAELQRAHDATDLVGRTLALYADGERAMGYASDLVGNACGVALAAS